MFMMVMSLALSLLSAPSSNSFLQQESRSNAVPDSRQTAQLQQEKKDPARSPGVINIPFKISVRPIAPVKREFLPMRLRSMTRLCGTEAASPKEELMRLVALKTNG